MAAIPDFMVNPNAVLEDTAQWRYGKPPDYTRTNDTFESTKTTSWAPESLHFLVQNLVKNWEKEASFKINPKEWRTINYDKYSFHLNGGPAMSADDMVHLGTYNAAIGPAGIKGTYETQAMDFSSSHKLFKGVMKTFNWEVVDVWGTPPAVSIKWRHWGMMTGDYVVVLQDSTKVRAAATNKPVEIWGMTTATIDDEFHIEKLETFWDPASLFNELLPGGVTVDDISVEKTLQAQASSCPVAASSTQ